MPKGTQKIRDRISLNYKPANSIPSAPHGRSSYIPALAVDMVEAPMKRFLEELPKFASVSRKDTVRQLKFAEFAGHLS